MKHYLYLILTLIFFALVGIGFLSFKSYQLNKAVLKDGVVKMMDETSDKLFVTKTDDVVLVESNGDREPMGTISGEICYPSQSIPPLVLYFEDIATGDVLTLETELNQDTFEFEVKPGSYKAFAYIKGLDESPGGYTEYVPCGLSDDCLDHTLIEFKVVDDGLTSDIDVCDWYGADVPDEPVLE